MTYNVLMGTLNPAHALPLRLKFYQGCLVFYWSLWSLQSIVGLSDLGQFQRQPFKDSAGSVIFVAVRHVTHAKNVNKNAYVRWSALSKLQPCLSPGVACYDSDTTAADRVATAVGVRFPPTLVFRAVVTTTIRLRFSIRMIYKDMY